MGSHRSHSGFGFISGLQGVSFFLFFFENPARHLKGISWFMQYLKLYYSGKISRLLNP